MNTIDHSNNQPPTIQKTIIYSQKPRHKPVIRSFKNIVICTEENPQINEIQFILNYLNYTCNIIKLRPDLHNQKWNGKFNVITDNKELIVKVELIKGYGSLVDYIIYDHQDPDVNTSIPILGMESTKTKDSESRNSAINQRFTKFSVFHQKFPNTEMILYYNTQQISNTPTNVYGIRLLLTYGVKIFDVDGKNLSNGIMPFMSVNEIITEKNNIKEKKGNISVKINEISPHTYTISAKLSKGDNKSICHDPNKGLITGIANCIYLLDKNAKFIITHHCVDLNKIKNASEKFWYSNHLYDLTLEGSNISSKSSIIPELYWKKDSNSEKASTINYQHHMEEKGWKTIYHNHSSSARSYFIDINTNTEYQVPKNITIPDVVMLNQEDKCIQICEGKILKDYLLGIKQLDNLTDFIEYITQYYKDYKIEKGLCLYVPELNVIETIQEKIKYKIFYGIDSNGFIYS